MGDSGRHLHQQSRRRNARPRPLPGVGEPAPKALPTVATFHSFCVRLLRREGAPLAQIRRGFTPLFTIYDDDDQISMLKGVYKALGLDDKFMQHRAALSRISHAKSHEADRRRKWRAPQPTPPPRAWPWSTSATRPSCANRTRSISTICCSKPCACCSTTTPTRERLNRRYEFLMVDEYQDTNRSQYELMRLLTERAPATSAVVGDEDQSIYGWRGANIRNILDFERDFPGAIIIRLEQNYRSTKNILEAASAVVANNTERIGKWLWTDAGAGEKITLYEAPDSENEALWIADTIENRAGAQSARITSRCSTAPTRSRARSKKPCGATAASTSSSAASASTSAPK